ncbi:MAG: hypothetical protein Q4B58_02750 [Bacteroidales bacterium]|nr:hypothetical protein [Bacteroidales bacterium]
MSKKKTFQTTWIFAKTSKQLAKASEHLRFWPFVKSYHWMNNHTVEVTLYIGHCSTQDEEELYLHRASRVMQLCLNQYQVRVGVNFYKEADFRIGYSADLFLRPNDKLKPFKTFLCELEKQNKKEPF